MNLVDKHHAKNWCIAVHYNLGQWYVPTSAGLIRYKSSCLCLLSYTVLRVMWQINNKYLQGAGEKALTVPKQDLSDTAVLSRLIECLSRKRHWPVPTLTSRKNTNLEIGNIFIFFFLIKRMLFNKNVEIKLHNGLKKRYLGGPKYYLGRSQNEPKPYFKCL